MPHTLYDTTIVVPILNDTCVGVVNPVGIAKRLTVVEMDEVEAVERRVLACEFIHLLRILRIPVYISHCTCNGFLSKVLYQVSIEFLGRIGSIRVHQARSDVKLFSIPVVISTGREAERVLGSEIIQTVTHRRLHYLDLIVCGTLCMQRNNQLITLGIRKGIIHIIKGGVIGIYFNCRVRSCIYRLIVCDNHIDEGIEFRSSIFWRHRHHRWCRRIVEMTRRQVIGVVVRTCSKGHSQHRCTQK